MRHPETERSAFPATAAAALLPLVALLAGCTPEEAAIFGKILFGGMIAAFVVIPVVFWRLWRRRGIKC